MQTDLAEGGKNDKIIEDEKFEHEAVHEVENVENIEQQNEIEIIVQDDSQADISTPNKNLKVLTSENVDATPQIRNEKRKREDSGLETNCFKQRRLFELTPKTPVNRRIAKVKSATPKISGFF